MFVVYGRENRLRVARDEEESAQKKEQERAEREEREREARYRALCATKVKNVVVLDETKGAVVEEREEKEMGGKRRRGDEKEERRGDPLTRTSDAVFDQSFRFARGMQERPWWCGGRGSVMGVQGEEGVSRVDGDEQQQQGEEKKKKQTQKQKKGVSCLGYVKVIDARDHGRRMIQGVDEDQEERRGKKKKKKSNKKESKNLVYETLRQERLAREADERDKAEQCLKHST